MKTWVGKLWGGLSVAAILSINAPAATYYVDVNCAHPIIPYTSWAKAATNIQDAISWAGPGDTVLVTNGVYQYGAYSASGNNRVYIPRNVTVQSVNGPAVTTIMGYQVPGTTNGDNAVRCVCLGYGSNTLSGFTLTNGATQISDFFGDGYGGGVYCQSTSAVVTNCVIVGNAADYAGAGASGGVLYNCLLSRNTASSYYGGGAYQSTLYSCTVTSNSASYSGGGAAYSTLINCTLSGNAAKGGGGACGGTLYNCTISGNSAYVVGGSASQSTLFNCIAYYNSPDNGYESLMTNCCTTPLPTSGANNFTNPPAFVDLAGGNLRLQIGSPCINAGNNSFVTNSTDLDGNPRIVGGTVDVGAYENQNTNPVHYVSLISTNPVSPYTNWITAATNIQDAVGAAQSGETVVVSNGIYKSGSAIVYGQEANRVALTNAATLLGLNGPQSTVIVGSNQMRCVYVGSNAVLNGFTLANGMTSSSGDSIKEQSGGGAWCETSGVISNCVFGGTSFPYVAGKPENSCSAQQEGGGVYGGTIYNSTLGCNGAPYGGAAAAANLINCVVTNNALGIYQGTASNCTFTANGDPSFSVGGGYQSTLYNCTLTGNQGNAGGTCQCTNYNCILANNSGVNGGGASGGVLYNCILSSNTASSSGGGAYESTLINCTLSRNTATAVFNSGGGAEHSTLYGCTITSNSARAAGGAEFCTLYNCTISGNSASSSAGGAGGGILYNCIVFYNSAPRGSNYYGATLNYCDTMPLASGSGNITNEPAFVNRAGGDFHLQSNSPCINSGNNAYVTATNDLDGHPRIAGGTVDMGAYEYQSPSSVLSYAWAQQYGLPTDGSADYADSDSTGMNNWQKWIAGLIPANPASVLALLAPAVTNNAPGLTVSWQSVNTRTYYLQRATSLTTQPAFTSIQSNIVGQAGSTSYTDSTATNGGPYFYRVGVQ